MDLIATLHQHHDALVDVGLLIGAIAAAKSEVTQIVRGIVNAVRRAGRLMATASKKDIELNIQRAWVLNT